MPDTPENQEVLPQLSIQRRGTGFPIARCCAVITSVAACVGDAAIGPNKGKETGESALLHDMLDSFDECDVAVFGRYYCSLMMLAMLSLCGVHARARLHHRRIRDFRRGHGLGPDDHLITSDRPKRPQWLSAELYMQISEKLTVRELKSHVRVPGRRTETIAVITTLIDPEAYSAENIAQLYGVHSNVELDTRDVKQTLGLDHLRCKTPHTVRREL